MAAGFRTVGRLSLPTQVFQINEPIFFGPPIIGYLVTGGDWRAAVWGAV